MTDRDPTRRPGGTLRARLAGLRREAFVRCPVPGCRRPRWPGARGVCRAHRAAELEAVARFDAEARP